MTGIALPGMDKLPPGPRRDLVEALHELYRQAGFPGTRTISKDSRDRGDVLYLRDTISHEGVSAMLRGEGAPRWSKIECLVRILVDRAVGHPEVEATLARFHELWLLADGVGSTTVSLPEVPTSSTQPITKTTEFRDLWLRADAGDEAAATTLVARLNLEFDAGDDAAATPLIAFLTKRTHQGDESAARLLLSVLRKRADAGDWAASDALDQLLADRGDLGGLRQRADTNESAARQLAPLLFRLAKGGAYAAITELIDRAAAGDPYAAHELTRLEKRADDGDDAGPAATTSTEVEQSTGPPAEGSGSADAHRGRASRAQRLLKSLRQNGLDASTSRFTVTDVRRLWPEILKEVKANRRFTWILLDQNAEAAALRNGTLLLTMSNVGARDTFDRGDHEAVLRQAIVNVMGTEFAVETVVDERRTLPRPTTD
jgi:hypothetical protein